MENCTMNLKPLSDRLVVEVTEQSDSTGSGLFLPETAREESLQGKVVAAGPGVRKEDGERIAMDIAVGDIVMYPRYVGAPVKVQGKEYLIFKEKDLLAIVANGQA
jgi:chaperonin GroES